MDLGDTATVRRLGRQALIRRSGNSKDDDESDLDGSQIVDFENRRWSRASQTVEWRHTAALQLVRAAPVLDVGGGDGLFVSELSRRGIKDATVLDISPVALERAASDGFNTVLTAPGKSLPFPADSFATATALDVLEHTPEPMKILSEMRRVALEAVIVVPNFSYWRERLDVLRGEVSFQSRPERGHVYWFNHNILNALVEEAGWTIDTRLYGGFLTNRLLRSYLPRLRPNLFSANFALRLIR